MVGSYRNIDLSALGHNLAQVRTFAPKSKILAIVKSDAYGHGLSEVISSLKDADGFGVGSLDEALLLRNLGIDKPILLLFGPYHKKELLMCSSHNISIVVHNYDQCQLLEQNHLSKRINVWLKVNTGMNRLGFSCDLVHTAMECLNRLSYVNIETVMTHFHSADDLNNNFTNEQQSRLQATCSNLNIPFSLSNSAGIIGWQDIKSDWVRPGLMLYGISPFNGYVGSDYGLIPVMEFKSKIIGLQDCRKGDIIGYGATWVCPYDMKIGIVGVGYYKGYPRSAPNGTPVMVNGIKTRLVGRVSMEMIAVDLTDVRGGKIGDEVLLWGKELPIEKIAKYSGIIPYELLCHAKE